jgi:hypothetical protein
MSEPEFQAWQVYAARRMLPQRRMEMYLAQIAMLIAATMGGVKNAELSDYLFDPAEPEHEPTAEEEAAFFEFKPRAKPAQETSP